MGSGASASPNGRETRVATDIDQHATDLLEAIYEAGRAGRDPDEAISDYLQRAGHDVDYGFQLVDLLASLGLVKPYSTFGTPRAMITPAGIQAMQQLVADRANPKVRSAVLRTEMITWLDAQEEQGVHPGSFQEFADQLVSPLAFSERELRGAAELLLRHSLIDAVHLEEFTGGWIAPRLTVEGRDCITDCGGDVGEYLRDRRRPGPGNDSSLADDIWST
ncbi:hypothetical protein EV137_2706 [Kribbella pratensis]|uniref:Uncharacterized protein n=1 Tax=Kribbella pratensis TaxID=2512112 RepID=A0ABY2FQF1_9ACTN|nr:hypothetical protein EV137_2706 [Kribbella pratensis]